MGLSGLAAVTVEDVRDVINVSQTDVPDAKLLKMIRRAAVAVGLELGREINPDDCSEAEKEAVTVLAAIYCICYLTGGSAVGLSFRIGDQNVSVLDEAPPLNVLRGELERILKGLKEPYVGVA
ncbi:MAG: hypothetical protein N3F10_06625 [Candidatus Bathyarchaeota archaeon]|nr:hypothetical protein [Candidatus Bathyarchaeota archaeon]